MDKSESIDANDFQDMKESIVSIAGGLETGSKVSVIAFSGQYEGWQLSLIHI